MDDDEVFEDPPEYATIPDDVNFKLSQSFVNFVMVTIYASIMVLWYSYHVLGIFRTAGVLHHYRFYEIIYRCELYISLYAVAKFMLLLNPLWCFYYWKEICNFRSVKRYGVTHE